MFLHQGAEWEQPVEHAVHAERTVDALLFPDLAADLGAGVDANGTTQSQEAIHAAALPHSLSHLAGRQAWCEVGDDAHTAVAEAAAKTLGKLTHFVSKESVAEKGGSGQCGSACRLPVK